MTCTTRALHLLSGPGLLAIAEGAGWRAAAARVALRERVRRGDVDDLDYDRTSAVLGLD